jgi:hypothetical protein
MMQPENKQSIGEPTPGGPPEFSSLRPENASGDALTIAEWDLCYLHDDPILEEVGCMAADFVELSFAEMQKNVDRTVLGRLMQELRLIADNCPNCQGAREYSFTSRGRDNMVHCVRCEPLYKILELLAPAEEMLRGDSPY